MPPSSILSTFLGKYKKRIHYIRKLWIWRGYIYKKSGGYDIETLNVDKAT